MTQHGKHASLAFYEIYANDIYMVNPNILLSPV